MCGIFFYIGRDPIKGKIKKCLCKLSNSLTHRGPDQECTKYYNTNVFASFHRLAVIDPTPTGIQPFESVNKRFICMVNGEIYNYK